MNKTNEKITEINILIKAINKAKLMENYSWVIRNRQTLETIKTGLIFYKFTLLKGEK